MRRGFNHYSSELGQMPGTVSFWFQNKRQPRASLSFTVLSGEGWI